jgi:hypothetical protein
MRLFYSCVSSRGSGSVEDQAPILEACPLLIRGI